MTSMALVGQWKSVLAFFSLCTASLCLALQLIVFRIVFIVYFVFIQHLTLQSKGKTFESYGETQTNPP